MATLRDQIPLERRKILKKSIRRVLRTLVIGSIVSVVFFLALNFVKGLTVPYLSAFLLQFHKSIGIVWLVAFAILLLWAPIYELLYYLCYHYDTDDYNLTIRKGVLIRREITLPFQAITDVYIDQDILDVGLLLYDVHISTPTVESGLFAHIDGVGKRNAVKLKRVILARTNEANEV